MENPIVLALKESLRKKILKQQQKEFKSLVQSFLANPSQNISKLQVKPFELKSAVKKVQNILLTQKEQESKIKIIIQNEVLMIRNAGSDAATKNPPEQLEEEEETGLLSNKYGEEKATAGEEFPNSISQSLPNPKISDEVSGNKVYYQKVLKKLKEDVLAEMENIVVSKSKYAYKHGSFLLKFIKNFKNQKRESLLKLSINFYDVPSLDDLRKDLQELNNDKYEHIEQKSECEEVELERIDEASSIFKDIDKKNEEQEYLSFLKAGVPTSQRVLFYNHFYNIMSKKENEENTEQVSQIVDYLQLVDK